MHPGLQCQVLLLKKFGNALKDGLNGRADNKAEITCSEISVSGLENFAQPVEPLLEVPHILGGGFCDT